jgi:hypothetical protein
MQNELSSLGRSFHQARVLEIGTGWFPTVPIMLSLRGAKKVFMTDVTPHLDDVTFTATVTFLRNEGGEFAQLRAASKVSDFALTYLAPFDLSQIPDGSIDCVISRTVLEHIPKEGLVSLFHGLRAKLSPHGFMVHCVDHSDHLGHQDKRITMVNFLTWPDWKHALVNWLTKEGENRLRHCDYVQLFQRAGYQVLLEKRQIHRETEQHLRSLTFAPRFKNRPASELATLRSLYVVASNPEAATIQAGSCEATN